MIHNNNDIEGNNAIVGNNAKGKRKAVKSKTGKSGGKLQRYQAVIPVLPKVTITKEYYHGIPHPGFLGTKIAIENRKPNAQQQRKAHFVKKGKVAKVRYYNGSAGPAANMKKMLKAEQLRSGIAGHHGDGALEVNFKFEFKLPTRPAGKKKGDPYDKKVDLDNLQKFMLDAMTGIFYGDDSIVCTLSATKVYGDVNATTVFIWKHNMK